MSQVRARCPDCAKALGPLAGALTCPGCGRAFAPEAGVWDLRPLALGAVQAHEDLAHLDPGPPTWRRLLLHKRHWIEWTEQRWLPAIVPGSTRSFLEIGGGLCYAAALAKAREPRAFVVATDISPRYLRQHALRAGEILGTPADAYAAADAETLPFEDGSFDAVLSQMVLYRLPDPARALHEIRRVLAPGGRYLGVERASPWAWPALVRERRAMSRRSRQAGLAERPWTYGDWRRLVARALPAARLEPVPGRRLRAPRLRLAANALLPIHVTIRLGG
jgi:ubiquinone/menaquinone biosynthesis C-methylase UbiE